MHDAVVERFCQPQQCDAARGESPEVDGVSAVCSADGDGHMLGATRWRRSVPFAEDSEPPAEVATAIASRRPIMRPDREVDLAARLLEFVGDLHPRRSCSDNEDGAVGQLLRIAVRAGVNLMDSGAVGNDRRNDRPLERARCGHDISGLDGAVGCFHAETCPAVVLPYGRHLDAGTDRCVDFLRVGREVVRDLLLGGESVGVDVEFLTGKSVVPCGSVGDQGVPPP